MDFRKTSEEANAGRCGENRPHVCRLRVKGYRKEQTSPRRFGRFARLDLQRTEQLQLTYGSHEGQRMGQPPFLGQVPLLSACAPS